MRERVVVAGSARHVVAASDPGHVLLQAKVLPFEMSRVGPLVGVSRQIGLGVSKRHAVLLG